MRMNLTMKRVIVKMWVIHSKSMRIKGEFNSTGHLQNLKKVMDLYTQNFAYIFFINNLPTQNKY